MTRRRFFVWGQNTALHLPLQSAFIHSSKVEYRRHIPSGISACLGERDRGLFGTQKARYLSMHSCSLVRKRVTSIGLTRNITRILSPQHLKDRTCRNLCLVHIFVRQEILCAKIHTSMKRRIAAVITCTLRHSHLDTSAPCMERARSCA